MIARHERYAATWPEPVADGTPIRAVPLDVPTPFGPFTAGLSLDGHPLPLVPDDARLHPGGVLRRWRTGVARVDQVAAALPGPLGPHREPLLGCVGVAWRVRAVLDVGGLEAGARLPGLRPGLRVWPSGGQALAAVEVEDDRSRLWIGGPDDDWLWHGAGHGPAAWHRRFVPDHTAHLQGDWEHVPGQRTRRDGIAWDLPGLRMGESVSCHVAVAWQRAVGDDVTGWFAVDTSWGAIVDQALGVTASR